MDIKPITREEMYLAAAAGEDVTLPAPITRKEIFLASLAGMDVKMPETQTRQERFIKSAAVAQNVCVIEPLTVTENGTYTAPDGVDGYNPVTVNVDPTKITILREQQFDGFVWDESFGAYSPGYVTPALFRLENGKTYHVDWDGIEYECVAYTYNYNGSTIVAMGNGGSLGLPSNGEPFLITYNAPYDNTQMFSTEATDSHTVGIWQKAESGGGSLPAGAYWEALPIPYVNIYRQMWFEFNGVLYALINVSAGSGWVRYIYKYINNAWTIVKDFGTANSNINTVGRAPIEYNGKMHIFSMTYHFTFDGVSVVQKNKVPSTLYSTYQYAFVQDGKLKVQSESGMVYVWDEASDTWAEEKKLSEIYVNFFNINGVVYAFRIKNVYIYSEGNLTQFATLDETFNGPGVEKDGKVYWTNNTSNINPRNLYEFNPVTKATRIVGAMPITGASTPMTIYNNKIALLGYEVSYPATCVLHEVTE